MALSFSKPLPVRLWSTHFRCAFSTHTSSRASGDSSNSPFGQRQQPPQRILQRGRRSLEKLTPAQRQKAREEETSALKAKLVEKNMTREWRSGDVYAPHDLSASEMKKWRKRFPPSTDAFDALSLNPLSEYKNFSIMSEYMSEMGRIRHRSETGLRPVNQRKIAKAIRRAIGLGLMPSVHRHPEVISKEHRDLISAGKNP